MTTERDTAEDMAVPLLDGAFVEAILAGRAIPDDECAGFRRVATLVRAARSAAVTSETEIPASLLGTLTWTVAGSAASRTRPRISRIGRRAAIVTGSLLLVTTGAAAAATNHLPDPIQNTVADIATHVGLRLPRPDATEAPLPPSTDQPAVTIPAGGPPVRPTLGPPTSVTTPAQSSGDDPGPACSAPPAGADCVETPSAGPVGPSAEHPSSGGGSPAATPPYSSPAASAPTSISTSTPQPVAGPPAEEPEVPAGRTAAGEHGSASGPPQALPFR